MTATITIRDATHDDAHLIVNLIRELADYEKLRDEAVATEEDIARALFGPRPYAEALIAEWDGAPVGFALFFHNFSTFEGRPGIYLEDLFVREAYRGKGLGLALLRHIAGLAVARGCARFEWSVLDWNTPSIGFYESLGARRMADWSIFRLTGDALAKLATGQRGDSHE